MAHAIDLKDRDVGAADEVFQQQRFFFHPAIMVQQRATEPVGRPAQTRDLRWAAPVSLPVACLNGVVSAAPRGLDQAATLHKLDGWSLSQSEAGLLLTLRLPDSSAISFSLASQQLLAMASVIPTTPGRLLH